MKLMHEAQHNNTAVKLTDLVGSERGDGSRANLLTAAVSRSTPRFTELFLFRDSSSSWVVVAFRGACCCLRISGNPKSPRNNPGPEYPSIQSSSVGDCCVMCLLSIAFE